MDVDPVREGASRRESARALVVLGVLVATGTGLTVAVLAAAPGVPAVDAALHDAAVAGRDAVSLEVARVVSWFGQTNVALPLVVIAGFAAATSTRRYGRLRAAAILLGVGWAGVLIGLGLNALVARIRPAVLDWAGDAGGFSFPSGHTTAATVAAGLMAWAVTRRMRTPVARAWVWTGAGALAAAVGWSRVWLGVHWPTDVMAGWLVAATALVAAREIQLRWWPQDAPPVRLQTPTREDA